MDYSAICGLLTPNSVPTPAVVSTCFEDIAGNLRHEASETHLCRHDCGEHTPAAHQVYPLDIRSQASELTAQLAAAEARQADPAAADPRTVRSQSRVSSEHLRVLCRDLHWHTFGQALVPTISCSHCQERFVGFEHRTVHCLDCETFVCPPCSDTLHGSVSTQSHLRYMVYRGTRTAMERQVVVHEGLYRCAVGHLHTSDHAATYSPGVIAGKFGCLKARFGRRQCPQCTRVAHISLGSCGLVSSEYFPAFALEQSVADRWLCLTARNPRIGLSTCLESNFTFEVKRGCVSQQRWSEQAAAAVWNVVLTKRTTEISLNSRGIGLGESSACFADAEVASEMHADVLDIDPSVASSARSLDVSANFAPVKCPACEHSTSTMKCVDATQKLRMQQRAVRSDPSFSHENVAAAGVSFLEPGLLKVERGERQAALADDTKCDADLSVRATQAKRGGSLLSHGLLTAVCSHSLLMGAADLHGPESYMGVIRFLDQVTCLSDQTIGYDSACQVIPILQRMRDSPGTPSGDREIAQQLLARSLVVDNLHAVGHAPPCSYLFGAFHSRGSALLHYEGNESLNAYLQQASGRLQQMSAQRRTTEVAFILAAWSERARKNLHINTASALQRTLLAFANALFDLDDRPIPSFQQVQAWQHRISLSRKNTQARKRRRSAKQSDCSGSVRSPLRSASEARAPAGLRVAAAVPSQLNLAQVRSLCFELTRTFWAGATYKTRLVSMGRSSEETAHLVALLQQVYADIMRTYSLLQEECKRLKDLAVGKEKAIWTRMWRHQTPITTEFLSRWLKTFSQGLGQNHLPGSTAAVLRQTAASRGPSGPPAPPWFVVQEVLELPAAAQATLQDEPTTYSCSPTYTLATFQQWRQFVGTVYPPLTNLSRADLHRTLNNRSEEDAALVLPLFFIDQALKSDLHPVFVPVLRWACSSSNTAQLLAHVPDSLQSQFAALPLTLLRVACGGPSCDVAKHTLIGAQLCDWLATDSPHRFRQPSAVYDVQESVMFANSSRLVKQFNGLWRCSESLISLRQSVRSMVRCCRSDLANWDAFVAQLASIPKDFSSGNLQSLWAVAAILGATERFHEHLLGVQLQLQSVLDDTGSLGWAAEEGPGGPDLECTTLHWIAVALAAASAAESSAEL